MVLLVLVLVLVSGLTWATDGLVRVRVRVRVRCFQLSWWSPAARHTWATDGAVSVSVSVSVNLSHGWRC